MQRVDGVPTDYFPPVRCNETFDPDNQSRQFYAQIEDFWCPDQGDKKVTIQNYSKKNTNGTYQDFFFLIDTCSHMAKYTGRTDCVDEE